MRRSLTAAGVLAAALIAGCAGESEAPLDRSGWARHTIDASSAGADGVRLGDVDGNGLPDIATAWEEGGEIRVYLNPGPGRARQPWPAVTVGRVDSPEDAVFVDLDGDGAFDVVSAAEGETRSLFAHWAPTDRARLLEPAAWTSAPLAASTGRSQWMFTLPLASDDGVDLIAGAKNEGAAIERFPAPADPRDSAAWRPQKLYEAGWIMSLRAHDVDADGDLDVVASDRKGPRRGALWLENPGPGRPDEPWSEHRIGAVDHYEAMFLTVSDLDGDGLDDVVIASRGGPILFHRRLPGEAIAWETFEIAAPDWAGTGKAVAVGDLDGDGRLELVSTCENAVGDKHGVVALSYRQGPTDPVWEARSISGPAGVKFDRLELLDLDGDGDLDVLTCEERDNLGVVWYENPSAAPPQGH